MRLSEMNITRSDYPLLETNGHEDTFPEGITLTFVCETRISQDVPNEEAVGAVVVVDIGGETYKDVLSTDFAVKFQNSAVKNYFKSQDHYREWAEENATLDNPHRVGFSQLGSVKQFETMKEKARRYKAFLRANGIDPSDKEAVMQFLEQG